MNLSIIHIYTHIYTHTHTYGMILTEYLWQVHFGPTVESNLEGGLNLGRCWCVVYVVMLN